MPELSRFSIYSDPPARPQRKAWQQKRVEESRELMPFLLRLEEFITLDDVQFGQDPPDFVFQHQNASIGVELTDLVPERFENGGYRRRGVFKSWRIAINEVPQPRHEFEWGNFSLRESLASFAQQLETKSQKASKWKGSFSESWLLMHIGSGSPFGGLVATGLKATLGREADQADHRAKAAYGISSICQRTHPFSYVILYSGMVVLAFPKNSDNPYKFPTPRLDVIARGEKVSDEILDWQSNSKSIVDHPLLDS